MKHNVSVIGLDIAKNIFYAVGADAHGHEVLKRKLTRNQVLAFFANLPAAKVGIEACASAHYWARQINALGHEVKLIAGQHVSRRVVGNKNDYRDAKVICELRSQPQTLYVPINTEAQQDVQMLHRVRQRLVENRTALLLQIRGLLGEYGISFPQGPTALRTGLIAVLGGEHAGLSARALEIFCHLQVQLTVLDEQVDEYDERIRRLAREDRQAAQLMDVPGIGPLSATALIASLGHAHHFPAGRNFAANLGLTPHEHSSGGNNGCSGSPNEVIVTCAPCLSTGPAVLCVAPRTNPTGCCNGRSNSRTQRASMWPPVPWPTNWRASLGPFSPTIALIRRSGILSM